jgi:hypothetical protein
MRVTRGTRARFDLGDYYVINVRISGVVAKDIDLEDLGRETEALRPWERLVD